MKMFHRRPYLKLENKLSKKIGLLYRAKQVLDKTLLKSIYFSYIYFYLSYGNTA